MITKEVWNRLSDSVKAQAASIQEKSWSCFNHYSIEECVKSGRVSATLGMILELESTLRVLKRRLILALPAEEQKEYPID